MHANEPLIISLIRRMSPPTAPSWWRQNALAHQALGRLLVLGRMRGGERAVDGGATLCLLAPRSRITGLTQLLPAPALESRGTGARFATKQGGRRRENRRQSQ